MRRIIFLSITYDAAGQVQTVTDSEGYVISTAYDNLDRPTTTTYPDGATAQTFVERKNVATSPPHSFMPAPTLLRRIAR
jgi:YD repeat-containing protein